MRVTQRRANSWGFVTPLRIVPSIEPREPRSFFDDELFFLPDAARCAYRDGQIHRSQC